jgi:hypothetical protein
MRGLRCLFLALRLGVPVLSPPFRDKHQNSSDGADLEKREALRANFSSHHIIRLAARCNVPAGNVNRKYEDVGARACGIMPIDPKSGIDILRSEVVAR